MKFAAGGMTPINFDECFGWLHTPVDNSGTDIAVVICPGLLRDGLVAYYSLRQLGDKLARAGYWVLRFDYPGTGNSLDDAVERTGGHWAAWQQSVDRACDWLRQTSGASRLILAGVRAGATLATLATARRDDVAGLLMFEPVINGRSYVRQLILEADLQNGRTSARGEDLDIREFHFSAATLDQLASVDLRRVKLKAGLKVAVFAQAEARQLDEGIQAWSAGGAETARHGWEGLTPLLLHSEYTESEPADFSTVMAWFKRALPAQALPPRPLPAEAKLAPEGCIETPLWFGDNLFGVLSRPTNVTSDQIVLIGNGGRDPHYGAARQNVEFSRFLAKRGIACLRFDFAGLGDSIGPPGKEYVLSRTFTDRLNDIRAALDALQQLDFRRFAMLGLCSGAFHAFHAALAEPRLTSLMLVNLPLFSLPTNSNLLEYVESLGKSPGSVARRLGSWSAWNNLISGQKNAWSFVRAFTLYLGRQIVTSSRRLGLKHEQSFATRSMAKLSGRGARALFLYSSGETEIDVFAGEFGSAGQALANYAGSKMMVLERMDHSLTRSEGRRDVEKEIVDYLLPQNRPAAAA